MVTVIIGGLFYFKNNSSLKETDAASTHIKVGVIIPLSGPLAEYGVAYKNGILLSAEKSNNKNIEYIFEDSDYTPAKSIAAYNKLVGIDHVNVVMSWGGVPTDAVYPLLKDKKIPFLAGSSLARVIDNNPYTIRTYDTPEYFAQAMWKYFRAHNQKNIAILKVDHVYTNSILDALNATKNADEKITVVENYNSPAENDFRTSILKIKKSNVKYDTLGVLLFAGQIGTFYNQKAQMGLDMPTFGTDFFESKTDIDQAGKNIDGAVYANFLVTDEFENQYMTRFGNLSQISQAGFGYDMALIVNKLTSNDPDEIMKTFKNVSGITGVIGSHKFIETANDRYFDEEVHMKVIQEGKISEAK